MGIVHDDRDNRAHAFIEGLALLFADSQGNPEPNVAKVYRYTPSVKLGRRYLTVVGTDGFVYSLTLEVEPSALPASELVTA